MQLTTFDHVWALVGTNAYEDRKGACRSYWNSLSLAKQRQIYYTIREQKRRGEYVKENPLFAIQDCSPQPTNWNGKDGINKMIKSTKMVIAKYGSVYGTYTAFEAKLFEMTDVKPLN